MNIYYEFGGKWVRAFYVKGYRGHPSRHFTVCASITGWEGPCKSPLGKITKHGPKDYQIEGSEEHFGSLNSAVERVVLR